jgi:RND family efflux transporter MFP subunit
MKNNIILWVAATIVLSACSQPDQEPQKIIRPVRTMIVTAPDLSRIHEFTAVVDAARKADLSFKVSGELIELKVNQGEKVVAGQVIAKLNDRDLKIQLQEVESSFDKATADYSRAKKLIRSNTISQADYDQLKAQYNSAKAKLATARNNLEYTELKASFDGIIAKRYTENFQEIQAKSAVVALHDLSSIVLKIDVSESLMINVKRQDAPLKLTAKFDAIKGEEFPLEFKEVSTQADEVTRTYQVTFTMVAPKEHSILPGMTAVVRSERRLPQDSSPAYFFLPAKTVLKDSRGNYIYTVVKKSEGIGQVKRRTVTIGEITPFGIEIFTGIEQGDVVLTAGMSKVSDGLEVKF